MKANRLAKRSAVVLLSLAASAFSACGGGSSQSSSPPPAPIFVRINPSTATVAPNATQQFSATLSGTTDNAVAWSVQEGPSGGAISASGLYTAPATTGIFHIVASSHADPSKSTSALVSVTPPTPAAAWTLLAVPTVNGTPEPRVFHINVDSQDRNIIYAATDGGLYVSHDGGATWTFPIAGFGVITMDPNNVNRILFGEVGNLYLSSDRGVTWNQIASFPGYFRSVAISRLDPNTIYVGIQGAAGVFYRSTDSGVTWQSFAFGSDPDAANILPWVIAEDPLDGTLYVGVELSDHPQPYAPPLYRSVDRGSTWTNIAGSGSNDKTKPWWHVQNIAIDPITHKLYALQEGGGLYTSIDHGQTWVLTPNVFDCALIKDPNHANRFFGGWNFANGEPGGALLSTDDAESFQPYGLASRPICGLALSGDSSFLYAAAYNSGIYITPLN